MTTVVRRSYLWKPLVAIAVLTIAALATGPFWLRWARGPTELQLPGTVETQEVHLSSRVGGRVETVLVREGERVEAGQPIVELAYPELDAQLAQLEAQAAGAKATLDKLGRGARPEEKAAAKAAVDSAAARAARMNKGYRTEEIEQARQEVIALDAELQNAQAVLNRERQLLDRRATAMAQYDAAFARYGQLQGQVAAANAKLRMLEEGYRPEEIAEAEAELARLQANYDLILAGTREEEIAAARAQVKQYEAQIKELEIKRAERTVVAPEDVVVEILAVRPGDIVAPNAPVARVLRSEDLWVKAYISEVELGRIKLGQRVEVTIDTFPEKRFEGVVTYISSISEFTPRNVQTIDERRHQVFGFKVRVDDTQGVFKAGMAADVWLPLP